MAVLFDLTDVPDDVCDCTLETLAKALASDSFGDQSGQFRPLENRWARYLCEDVTQRFRTIIDQMEAALARFLRGDSSTLRKADVPWLRWDEDRFEQVRAYLETRNPGQMTMDDFSLLIDYLIQRYLPDSVIETEAEFLAVRGVLLGKIGANLGRDQRLTDPMLETLTHLLPTDFAHVPLHVLTPIETSILTYGKAHAGENIRHITENTRHRMAQICLEHVQGSMFGQKEGTWAYARQRLFDEFAALNRDFRRIAVTESGELTNQGFVAALQSGRQVKRIEAYQGACDFCRSINGKIYTVVDPSKPDRDGDTEIWVGKTNVGRSASPQKRVGNQLVPREKSELWWPAAGVQHPNCRGSWIPVTERPPEVSEQFFDFLQATLDAATSAS